MPPRSWRLCRSYRIEARYSSTLFQIDVDPERTELFEQDVERLGHAGLHAMVPIDDVLVHPGAAAHVVGT